MDSARPSKRFVILRRNLVREKPGQEKQRVHLMMSIYSHQVTCRETYQLFRHTDQAQVFTWDLPTTLMDEAL